MIKIKSAGRDSRLRAALALTSAYAVVAACGVAPAHADPSNCQAIPGLCDLTSNAPQSPIVVPTVAPLPEPTGIDRLRAASPDLSLWHFMGVGLIAFGLITLYGNRGKTGKSRTLNAGTARAGAYSSEKKTERSVGALMIGAGIISLAWALAGAAGLVVGGIVGGLIIASAVSSGSKSATMKSGYDQADAAWRQDVELAKLTAKLHQPNRAEFDPLGLGIAPPPAPPVQLPPEPMMNDADALRYARHGAHVELLPGSAAASLVARDGSWAPAEQAWIEACKAARLGDAEQRNSRIPGVNAVSEVFVPAADLARVEVLDNGDAAIVVRPRSLAVGTEQLAAVTPFLLRTARVRHAGAWVRAHADDTFVIVLSNRDLGAPDRTSGPAPADSPADDDEDW